MIFQTLSDRHARIHKRIKKGKTRGSSLFCKSLCEIVRLVDVYTQPVGFGRPPHLQTSFIGPF